VNWQGDDEVALEKTFKELCEALRRLRDELQALRVTVVEDKPRAGEVMLVDEFGNTTEEALGWIEEALVAATESRRAVIARFDQEGARRALVQSQEQFHQSALRLSADLLAYERIEELMRLGRARRGEWQAWCGGVKESLDRCQAHLFAIYQTLFTCWQELLERAAANSVSVQTTNIGQQISAPEEAAWARGGLP
jgi:hypothetical protein